MADQIDPKGPLAEALNGIFDTFDPSRSRFGTVEVHQLVKLWLAVRRSTADAEYAVLAHRPTEEGPPKRFFFPEPAHRPPHRRHDIGHQQHPVRVGGVVADDEHRSRSRYVLETLTLDPRQAGGGDSKDDA